MRTATVLREDSNYPKGRPHAVELRWFKLKTFIPLTRSTINVSLRREAESAFAAREQWAIELKCSPMDLRVELDE
jgi:hypothetical protein